MSIRVVPDQELDVIISQVKKHLTDCFFSLDSGNRLSIEISEHGGWWLADPSSRFFKAAERAVLENWEIPPLYIQEGGTMPISKFLEKTFTAPVIHIPFGQRTDQAHLENERIRLLNLSKGKDVFKSFVREVHSLRNAS